jgi:hypothetical protein
MCLLSFQDQWTTQSRGSARYLLVSYLVYSSTINMKVVCSSETSVHIQRTTRHYISDDRAVYSSHCEYCLVSLSVFSARRSPLVSWDSKLWDTWAHNAAWSYVSCSVQYWTADSGWIPSFGAVHLVLISKCGEMCLARSLSYWRLAAYCRGSLALRARQNRLILIMIDWLRQHIIILWN